MRRRYLRGSVPRVNGVSGFNPSSSFAVPDGGVAKGTVATASASLGFDASCLLGGLQYSNFSWGSSTAWLAATPTWSPDSWRLELGRRLRAANDLARSSPWYPFEPLAPGGRRQPVSPHGDV